MAKVQTKKPRLQKGECLRSDGRYCYRYITNSGERKTIYANSIKELREKEKKVLIRESLQLDDTKKKITVEEQVEHYFEMKSVKQSTKEANRKLLSFIRNYPIAKTPLNKVNRTTCMNFIRAFNDKYANETTKRVCANLKGAFELAVADKIIPSNPMRFDYHGMIVKHPRKKGIGLTDEEFDSLIDFMIQNNHWLVPHSILMRETGLRCSEMLGLTLSDVDFKNHLLTVNKQLLYGGDKGGFHFYVAEPKTMSSYGTVPLTEQAEMALHELIELCDHPITFDGYKGFFVLGNHGRLLRREDLYFTYKRLEKRYNEAHPKHPLVLSPHVFRHSTAAHFLNMGVSPAHVQKMLRHASPTMTLSVYTHIQDADIVKQLRDISGSKGK